MVIKPGSGCSPVFFINTLQQLLISRLSAQSRFTVQFHGIICIKMARKSFKT
jgi:hypothetical protein